MTYLERLSVDRSWNEEVQHELAFIKSRPVDALNFNTHDVVTGLVRGDPDGKVFLPTGFDYLRQSQFPCHACLARIEFHFVLVRGRQIGAGPYHQGHARLKRQCPPARRVAEGERALYCDNPGIPQMYG